jgi:AcrR family transcriptional regulator
MSPAPARAARPRPRSRRGEGAKLREEILDAAERLIVRAGNADAVSVRAIAEAVGVTPPAIYLHFPDKEALVLAVCERRFEQFDATIEAAGDTTDDPVESLRRRGRAYVQFGIEHPEAYRVLFMTGFPGRDPLDALAGAGARSFRHLVEAVERAIDADRFRQVDPLVAAVGIWTAVHGVTSLLITMPESFPWPERDALLDHICDVQLRGLSEHPSPKQEESR